MAQPLDSPAAAEPSTSAPTWLHLLCATVNVSRSVVAGCCGCAEFIDHPAEIIAARRDHRGPYRSPTGLRYGVVLGDASPAPALAGV